VATNTKAGPAPQPRTIPPGRREAAPALHARPVPGQHFEPPWPPSSQSAAHSTNEPRDEDPEDRAVLGPGSFKVRATAVGYIYEKRRRVGDVFILRPVTGTFSEQILDKQTGEPKMTEGMLLNSPLTREVKKTLTAKEQFNPRWMERVDASTPVKITSGNEALRQQHDEISRAKRADAEVGGPDHPTGTDVDVLDGD
jgi:hypothetical protein